MKEDFTIKRDGYTEIEVYPGISIESAYYRMVDYASKCCVRFNRVWIYSDDTLDDCYSRITGMSYTDYRATTIKTIADNAIREANHKAKIPELTKQWIEDGRNFIAPQYLDTWDKMVPIRLGDLYEGMELQAVKDILLLLDKDMYAEAKDVFYGQGHSGVSAMIVMSMIKALHDNGDNFVTLINDYEGLS